MNHQQQRIAIAEWYFNLKGGANSAIDLEGKGQDFVYPNYPGGLNAMHEAEKRLLDLELLSKKRAYVCELMKLVGVSPDMQGKWSVVQDFALLHATAAQRSEALCRALWPERF